MKTIRQKRAESIFREHGGHLHMSEALKLGITSYMLYAMRDRGVIEPITRGIYRLTDLPPIYHPDHIAVSLRFPKAVLCLISALSYHDLTTQIPHRVYVSVPRDARLPKLEYPSIHAYRFSQASYEAGIETHQIEGFPVMIYSVEKTLVDCFKFRNRIGMDVVLEALWFYRERRRFNVSALLSHAKVCRVDRVMRPYLETILGFPVVR